MLKAFDEMDEFERQMNSMLHAYFPSEHRHRPRAWRPPTDVYETDDAVIVKMEIAGMNTEDFTIAFSDRTLTVEGARRDRESKLGYHLLEIPYGEFRVQVYLPGSFAQDDVDARYENGFLYITLPKQRQEHRVPIRTGDK